MQIQQRNGSKMQIQQPPKIVDYSLANVSTFAANLGGIYVSPYLGEGAVSLYLTVSESSPVSGIQGLTYMYRLTYMYLLLIALICSNYYI